MKGGDINTIFLRVKDPDYFQVCTAELTAAGEIRRTTVTGEQLFALWRGSRLAGGKDLPFLTGCLVLHSVEFEHRKQFRQAVAMAPIKGCDRQCPNIFASLVCRLLPTKVSEERQRRAENRKRRVARSMFHEISKPLKLKWGYDLGAPPRNLYPLSVGEIEEMDVSEGCRSFLLMHLTAGRIDDEHRRAIETELQRQFSGDATLVAATMTDCKRVEPFAVIATPEFYGPKTVSLADDLGHWIRMEQHRFCQLVEQPDTPWEVGELVPRQSGQREAPLAVSKERSGLVQAIMTSGWRLKVKVLNPETDHISCSFDFLVDIDFAVVLAATLRRLREGEDVHRRWQEKALTTATRNLFTK